MHSFRVLKQIFLTQAGFSMMEAVIAIGLASVLGLGVMRLSEQGQRQTNSARANLETDSYIRGLRKALSDKATCESIVKSTPKGLEIDLTSYSASNKPPFAIEETRVLSPDISGVGREVAPASVFIRFDRSGRGTGMSATRKTTAMLEYTDGVFTGCSDYEAESEISAMKISCETLGGKFASGPGGSSVCDFSAIPDDHELLQNAKKLVCEQVYGGSYSGGKCDSVTVSGKAFGKNLKDNQFTVSGKKVTTFDQVCSGENEFMTSIKTSGEVGCKTIQFCVKGDGRCPADATAPKDSPKDNEKSLNCDSKDSYNLSAGNSAGGTNKCVFSNYSSNSAGDACVKNDSSTSAGICKKYKSGTCSGSTPGSIENYPDGTSCAVGKVCQSGSCVDEVVSGCWVKTGAESTLPDTNNAGYPNESWMCSYGTGWGVSVGDPCEPIGNTCVNEWKYGTRIYECQKCGG